MIPSIRITKEQHSSGTSCRLQDLQWEGLTVSVVCSPFVFRFVFYPTDRTLGEAKILTRVKIV